jgi:hypothetical protein
MINIAAIDEQLAEQDRTLRDVLSGIAEQAPLDPSTRAIVDTLAAGLAAIHERQGNLITLMLRTNT